MSDLFSSVQCVHAATLAGDCVVMLRAESVQVPADALRAFSTVLSRASRLDTARVSLRDKISKSLRGGSAGVIVPAHLLIRSDEQLLPPAEAREMPSQVGSGASRETGSRIRSVRRTGGFSSDELGHGADRDVRTGGLPSFETGRAADLHETAELVAKSSPSLQRRKAVALNTGDVVQGLPGTKPEPALVRCMPTEVQQGDVALLAPGRAALITQRVSSSADPRDGGSPSCSAKEGGRHAPTRPKGGPLHQVSGGLKTKSTARFGNIASGKDWVARGGASALMPRALHIWARIGFDGGGEASLIVLAGSVRHEQPANVNRERQLGTRSRPRGVNGVECVRRSSSAFGVSTRAGLQRARVGAVVEIRCGGGGATPSAELPMLRIGYARERDDGLSLSDRGSIPRESSGLCTAPSLASPSIRTMLGTVTAVGGALGCAWKSAVDDGGKTPRSGATGIQHSENDATDTRPKLGNRVKAEVVTSRERPAQLAHVGLASGDSASNALVGPTSNPTKYCAQHLGIASRLATVAGCATGSASARPASTERAA